MRHRLARTAARLALAAAALGGCAVAPPPSPAIAPEAASGFTPHPPLHGARFAIAAAHPLAVEAGQAILARGGSAVDAAIAAQLVLGLVEPQSSGIGGGAFMLVSDGPALAAYDGRETAPAAAGDDLFLDAAGRPWPTRRAILSGRSVGVPGALPMLELAHQRHGRLPWADLFAPAIALAEQGFAMTPRLRQLLAGDRELVRDPFAGPYFHAPDGTAWPIGQQLRNPEFADMLRLLARRGAAALSEGELADAIVAAVRRAPDPGALAASDLRAYRPQVREPLCFAYRVERALRVCGVPPPSAGTLLLGQMMGLMQRTKAPDIPLREGRPPALWLHLQVEAARLAQADRDAYVADPAFVEAPGGRWSTLLSPSYLDQRAASIGERAAAQVLPGAPAGRPSAFAPMAAQPEHGTSHLSVADARGQVVALTTSIESAFGSHRMVNRGRGLAGGFLLNNQLTDFSFAPRGAGGRAIANRVQPGKRPRSSMAPTLVFDAGTGAPLLVLGSPGGALIPSYLADVTWGLLHWKLDPQDAVALPHAAAANGKVLLEQGRFDRATAEQLEQRGHAVQPVPLTSGVHLLVREPGGRWGGAADPRREGRVGGN